MIDELRFNSSTNQLLGFMPSGDRDLRAAQLSPVGLTNQVLERPQEPIEFSLSNYSGPSDPDALRDEIAKRVLSQYARDGADADEITKQVLHSFAIEPQSHVAMMRQQQQGR